MTRTIMLSVCLVAGAGLGTAVLPVLVHVLPHDLHRLEAILNVLESPGRDAPRIVVLGDSRGEADVDATTLSAAVPGRPRAWNLSMHGQKHVESFLLYQELPSTVTTVVQFLVADDLDQDLHLTTPAVDALYLYGYRANSATARALEICSSEKAKTFTNAGTLTMQLRARWVIGQAPDNALRKLLRPDLRLDLQRQNFDFPTTFTDERMPGERFQGLLQQLRQAPQLVPVRIAPAQRCLIRQMIATSRGAGRQLIVVLPPTHPALWKDYALDHESLFGDTVVIDATRMFEDRDFADPLHLKPSAARRLSARIGAAIRFSH